MRFEGVTFGYDRERPVLEDIDLELEPGRTVALIGHTGSGKTTLASLVPRFYDVSEGRVTIDGVDVRDADLTSLRRAIGVIAQDPFLFSATVRENIAFGRPDATDDEVMAAAQAAQAHEFVERLPDGYDTVIGERGITLSGGQRQRVAIARALVVDPRILILDDATAAVDATTEARIRLGLREAMLGRTTIIIAHRLSTISLADEIIVLDRGRDRGAWHPRAADRDERGVRGDGRARAARGRVRSKSRGDRMRVWQPGSHLTVERGGEVRDWSWRQSRRRIRTLTRLARPYKLRAGLAIAALLAATATALAGPYLSKLAIDDGITKGNLTALGWIVAAFLVVGLAELGSVVRADVLHRLDGRAGAR